MSDNKRDPLEPDRDIDFRPVLMKLPIEDVLFAANYAMNRISLMELGALGHFLGGRFDMRFVPMDRAQQEGDA